MRMLRAFPMTQTSLTTLTPCVPAMRRRSISNGPPADGHQLAALCGQETSPPSTPTLTVSTASRRQNQTPYKWEPPVSVSDG